MLRRSAHSSARAQASISYNRLTGRFGTPSRSLPSRLVNPSMSAIIRRIFSRSRHTSTTTTKPATITTAAPTPATMPTNTALWLNADKARPLEVKPADFPSASDSQIVVKNAAVALNVVDWATQAMGSGLFPSIKYPTVLGYDVAGEVVDVGSAVKHIKAGDRVLGMGLGPVAGGASAAAFQNYTVVEGNAASPIPASIAYTDAVVIPLATATAASGLFQSDYLGLAHPKVPAAPANGETLLIWGGASSVGTNSIQMVASAGYEIITTASPKNWDYLKKLGASQVFDYNSPTVVDDIVKAFAGKKSAGAIAIGQTAAPPCIDIVSKIGGKQFVACANMPPKEVPEGVTAKFIFGASLLKNEVGPAVFIDYIPKGLANGAFVTSPPAEIIGKGFDVIQEGLDRLPKGVSAKKLVVDLS